MLIAHTLSLRFGNGYQSGRSGRHEIRNWSGSLRSGRSGSSTSVRRRVCCRRERCRSQNPIHLHLHRYAVHFSTLTVILPRSRPSLILPQTYPLNARCGLHSETPISTSLSPLIKNPATPPSFLLTILGDSLPCLHRSQPFTDSKNSLTRHFPL